MKKLTLLTASTLLATSALVYAGDDQNNSHQDSGHTQKMKMDSMPMNKKEGMMAGQSTQQAGMGMKMSPQMQKRRQAMQAEIMAIQNETDPAKRQKMMDAHMEKMQKMMNSMPMNGKQGMKGGQNDMKTQQGGMGMTMSPKMQKRRKMMQADMMAIRNETNPEKRQELMEAHMKKMQKMMNSMPMNGKQERMEPKHSGDTKP